MMRLPPLLGKALALAVPLGFLALIYAAAVSPVLDTYAISRDRVSELEAALARYDRSAREQAPRRAELAALKQRQEAQGGFLDGSNDTLLAAQLQNRIKALVGSGDGELVSAELLPVQEEGRIRRIAVRAEFSSSMAGVLHVFHGLESAYPFFFIDNVALRAEAPRRLSRAAYHPDGRIDVRFEAYGYVVGNETPEKTAVAQVPERRRR